MDNRIIYILFFVGGFIACYLLFKPESETIIEYKETIKSDTVYISSIDTVYLTKERIKHEYLRDTILIGYEPKINAFSATFPMLYGNLNVNGNVLGEVLQMTANSDFKIPQITNTIEKTRTETIIKKPTGVYAVGGISSDFSYSVGASYLRDKSMFGYRYNPNLQIHSLEVGFKVF